MGFVCLGSESARRTGGEAVWVAFRRGESGRCRRHPGFGQCRGQHLERCPEELERAPTLLLVLLFEHDRELGIQEGGRLLYRHCRRPVERVATLREHGRHIRGECGHECRVEPLSFGNHDAEDMHPVDCRGSTIGTVNHNPPGASHEEATPPHRRHRPADGRMSR